ncbi:hypothetical protein FRACA_220002 [Frankia canadensis]|uniref:Uncharacterized protein n=1 Tax=Frankia canadensis TaxID=1836972 RepID=A0A2I2KQX4_9ACTN|nr:hypothetical protein FRACA_220002 [Frankia canadensis]SOU55352.1 hypothetical protein FRACA_220002 [Frankia canadensis]
MGRSAFPHIAAHAVRLRWDGSATSPEIPATPRIRFTDHHCPMCGNVGCVAAAAAFRAPVPGAPASRARNAPPDAPRTGPSMSREMRAMLASSGGVGR